MSNPEVSVSGVNGSIQMSLLAFDKTVNLSVTGQLSLESYDPSFNQWDAVASCDVSLNTLRDMFIFQSDHFDVNDNIPEDIRFYVDASNIPQNFNLDSSIVINSPVTLVNANGTSLSGSDLSFAKDYIRHLSHILFNTPFGVDLFINEGDLLDSVNVALGDVWDSCRTDLECVSTNGTHGNLQGQPGSLYLVSNSETEDTEGTSKYNICRELFKMLVSRVPDRFTSLDDIEVSPSQANRVDSSAQKLYFLPLKVGDQILMRVVVKPDPLQSSFTGVSANDEAIRADMRAYIISLNLV
jgi:hypothetical protein